MTNNNPNFGFLSSSVSTLEVTINNGQLMITSLPQGINVSYESAALNIFSTNNKTFIVVPTTYVNVAGVMSTSLSVNGNFTSINQYPIYCVSPKQILQLALNLNTVTTFTFLILD